MKKILLFLLIVYFTAMPGFSVYSEDKMRSEGTIYLNNQLVDSELSVLINKQSMLIPLRTVLEAIGATVTWEQSTGNVHFNYNGIDYVCRLIALNDYFPENKSIMICKTENQGSENMADYIKLNPMAANGYFIMIDDRIYLNEDTSIRLLNALGYQVNIDLDQQKLEIISK